MTFLVDTKRRRKRRKRLTARQISHSHTQVIALFSDMDDADVFAVFGLPSVNDIYRFTEVTFSA